MNNPVVSYEFNNSKISFIQGIKGDYYVNATEMAKPFGDSKSPGRWLRIKEARTLIQAVVHKMDIPENQLVVIKRGFDIKQGTWLHETLAIEFARWLSMDFLLWTNQKLRDIMTKGFAVSHNVKDMIRNPEFMKILVTELDKEILQRKKIEVKHKHSLQVIEQSKPKTKYYDDVLSAKNRILTSVIAKELGMSAIEMNKLLNKLGVIFKIDKTWVLYSRFQAKGYTMSKTHTIEAVPNQMVTNIQTVWTEKGREFIHKTINDYYQQKSN